MYITQEVDYAMRIVRCLAKSEVRRDARSISEAVDVTLRFSLKILGKLSAAGIVKSFKGNKGGYELARLPAEITLRDVLAAVEGPYMLCRCITEEDCGCSSHGNCEFQRVFEDLSSEINRRLAGVTFQAVLEGE